MSLAIVGTDTGVGKTVISALVLARHAETCPLAYWKPVATGSCDERDTATVKALCPDAEVLPETFLFREPLSPHLAARREGRRIDQARLDEAFQLHGNAASQRSLVVEGAGGVLVPLDDDGVLLIDFLQRISLPCLVVARSTLGTINHTLLTLEALRHRELEIAGVVLNGPRNPENRRAIERFGEVEIVGELEPVSPLDAEAIDRAAASFDTAGHLAPFLASRPDRIRSAPL